MWLVQKGVNPNPKVNDACLVCQNVLVEVESNYLVL